MKPSLLSPQFALTLLLCGASAARGADIYTCVDASGKRLTSDRPIQACIDREQRQLSASGTVKRILPPSYTGKEAAALEAQKKQAEEERLKADAKVRSMAALVQRYPNAQAHNAARMAGAEEITSRIREGYARLQMLYSERAEIKKELEFYAKTPDSIPPKLRLQVQSADQSEKTATTYIAAQRQELVAWHKRYDEELAVLQTLWNKGAAPAASAAK